MYFDNALKQESPIAIKSLWLFLHERIWIILYLSKWPHAILAPVILLLLDAPISITQRVSPFIYVGRKDEHECFLRAICFRLKRNVVVFTLFFSFFLVINRKII